MTIKSETLESLLDSYLCRDVYVKSFRIDLLGTVDDTSHKITYTKNKKSGVLKVIDEIFPPDFIEDGFNYSEISTKKLVIGNTKSFEKIIYDFLRKCENAENIDVVCDAALFIVKIELSNGEMCIFESEFAPLYTIITDFYDYLSDYSNFISLIKPASELKKNR